MTEREMEDLLWNHPEKLLGEQLTRFERQPSSAVGRADLVFTDRIERFLVVEVKRGKLLRGAVEQLHDYYGVIKRRFPDRVVELMVVANLIPEERRLACDKLNIEAREISEKRFRDVASEVDYVFLSETSPPNRPAETDNGNKTTVTRRHGPGWQQNSQRGNPHHLRWERAFLREDCFDLRLVEPEALDIGLCRQLLDAVETADGINPSHFNADAGGEFQRWISNPSTPLRAQAYARLSNWFLTDKPDCRQSPLAQAASQPWNALFRVKPDIRLTLPKRNHKILPERFDLWWAKQLHCQNA